MFFNPIIQWLLRSPLHGLISTNTMLITFTGRKTGKQYTTPVNYLRQGNVITLFSRRERNWWKNFKADSPVNLRVKGQDLAGTARLIKGDEAAIQARLHSLYPKMSSDKAGRLAAGLVIIQVHLQPSGVSCV